MGHTVKKLCEQSKDELVKLARLVEVLYERLGDIDEISIESDGSVVLRREIYHRKPNGGEWFRQLIQARLESLGIPFQIIDAGEYWRPFQKATKSQRRSHWYAKIVIDPCYTVGELTIN